MTPEAVVSGKKRRERPVVELVIVEPVIVELHAMPEVTGASSLELVAPLAWLRATGALG